MVVAAMEAEVPFIVVHLDEFHKLAKLHDNKDKHKTAEYLFSELQSWLENGTYESANAWPKSRGLQDYNPHVIFMISGNVFPPSATVRDEEKDCKAVSKQIGAIMGSGTYGDDGARRPGTSLSLSLSRAFLSVCLSVLSRPSPKHYFFSHSVSVQQHNCHLPSKDGRCGANGRIRVQANPASTAPRRSELLVSSGN